MTPIIYHSQSDSLSVRLFVCLPVCRPTCLVGLSACFFLSVDKGCLAVFCIHSPQHNFPSSEECLQSTLLPVCSNLIPTGPQGISVGSDTSQKQGIEWCNLFQFSPGLSSPSSRPVSVSPGALSDWRQMAYESPLALPKADSPYCLRPSSVTLTT